MHIAITTLPDYSLQEKKQLARELKNTIAALTGETPICISVSVKDLPIDDWNAFICELSDDELIIPEACQGQADCNC